MIEGLCFGEESFGCFNIILDSTSAWSGGKAILAAIGPSHLVLFSGNCKVTNDSVGMIKKNCRKCDTGNCKDVINKWEEGSKPTIQVPNYVIFDQTVLYACIQTASMITFFYSVDEH